MRTLAFLACLGLLAGASYAQSAFARHNLEFGAAGVFPLSGYRATSYNAGPGWHAGYELRLFEYLGAEAGFTEAWPVTTETCNRFGCTNSRQPLKLLDYGLRGVAPLGAGRVELSIGLGGGYIWHPFGYSGPFGPNQPLFQCSGKAGFAVDRQRRLRLSLTVRAWRDLGRPTQQWLSTSGGMTLSLGGRH
jgi:hypothetical protein